MIINPHLWNLRAVCFACETGYCCGYMATEVGGACDCYTTCAATMKKHVNRIEVDKDHQHPSTFQKKSCWPRLIRLGLHILSHPHTLDI
jgi:hypothetical protein